MTTSEYFKQHPTASGVWKVSDDLYHAPYHDSAQAHALRAGVSLEWVERPARPAPKDAKQPEAAPADKDK